MKKVRQQRLLRTGGNRHILHNLHGQIQHWMKDFRKIDGDICGIL